MHILFLCPSFPKDEQDTSVLTYLVNYVKKFRDIYPRHRLSIIAAHYPFTPGNYSVFEFSILAMAGRNCGFPRSVLVWWKIAGKVRQLHAQQPIDLIHSFWLKEGAFFGSLISRSLQIPHVVTAMGTEVLPGNRWMIGKSLLRDYLVFVSTFQKDKMAYRLRLPSQIIPWGIEEFEGERPDPGRSIDLIFVGCLSRIKDVGMYLEVFARLINQFPKLRGCIIGEDVEHIDLPKQIRALGLEEHIEYLGKSANQTVLKKLGQSKVLLHPSHYESQGYTFLEAIAQGVRIISQPVGIARAGTHWKIAQSLDEFAKAATDFLQLRDQPQPSFPVRLDSTVSQYHQLYTDLSKG